MTVLDAVFLTTMVVTLGYLLVVMLRDGRER
ncbi:hypothetical protein I598_1517 [Isoptericola dokdonensis DS-3]|uniref:Uncharacterized protein n=1 Tax=Isoptericola dokdonensis DS-3 TaxID=1300344 RepID=A0A161IKY7_9MICO|nr:hypothetical protein I598_1517 [Isoptericola dokdonensis DS-3]